MSRQLKRWESPRREGRNAKGKGGSARQRQLRKQFKTLSQKLKQSGSDPSNQTPPQRGNRNNQPGEDATFSPVLLSGLFLGTRSD
ncbi:hypothetical protein [Thermoleptolyngbya sp. M55_K2018_002]|uniref:hypothetical protein n=1 Tax=Thermoleptolyngbya sp. M55_K2018_002 TaxID=2747808 RepID=UPI0019DBA41A|nr:hypothetical protein [Thermoleptolyngbya sp. M55_K2018_002]HIK41667.1 hypothetical protein [Thermoleptolyngbya sp. M55_K2018_002]